MKSRLKVRPTKSTLLSLRREQAQVAELIGLAQAVADLAVDGEG